MLEPRSSASAATPLSQKIQVWALQKARVRGSENDAHFLCARTLPGRATLLLGLPADLQPPGALREHGHLHPRSAEGGMEVVARGVSFNCQMEVGRGGAGGKQRAEEPTNTPLRLTMTIEASSGRSGHDQPTTCSGRAGRGGEGAAMRQGAAN